MDYNNYKVFIFTDKQLKKKFSKEVLDKYYKVLAYLYQNGFSVNCENDEVEEQLMLFNNFKNESDLEDLRKLSKIESDYSTGKKIVIEELYDIAKAGKFCHREEGSIEVIKIIAENNWDKIKEIVNRVDALYNSSDSEIYNVLKDVKSYKDVQQKLIFIKDKISKNLKVVTWNIFISIINTVYSTYISLGKIKTDVHKAPLFENLNNEIYGVGGGYNPVKDEIYTTIFSSSIIEDVKTAKTTKSLDKLKEMSKVIIKENKVEKEEDINILFLYKFIKRATLTNDEIEKARRILVNCLLNGCLTFLFIKNNLNLMNEDKNNSNRADMVKKEFLSILDYCGIDKDYLL